MNPLQIPCVIESFRTLKDGSVKLDIETQELQPSDFAILAHYKNKYGYLLFKETEFSESEIENIPDVMPEFKNEKSYAQRFKAVLFLIHKGGGGEKKDFPMWYAGKMEALLEHYKEKIP